MNEYSATPLTCGKSPAEILYNRKLRTDLPILEDQLYITRYRKASQQKQNYYDRTAYQLPKLQEGDVVRLRNSADTAWTEKKEPSKNKLNQDHTLSQREVQNTEETEETFLKPMKI